MTEDRKGRSPRRPSASTYWLIARSQNGPLEVLLISLSSGEKALPVFSFREEAEMFHGLAALGRDWQVRESGAGEIVSVLYGLCSGVGRVALDPLPQTVAEKTVGPASWSRQRFADRILGEGRSHPNGHVRQTAVS